MTEADRKIQEIMVRVMSRTTVVDTGKQPTLMFDFALSVASVISLCDISAALNSFTPQTCGQEN
jgi:hypothetical protein